MPHITSNAKLGESWDKFITNHGPRSIPQIIGDLTYLSYAAQRDYGMTHEECLSIGLGKDEYKNRYNAEKTSI